LALKLVVEKAKRKGRTIYNCFVDFQKAFDSISYKAIWAILQSYRVGTRLIDLLKNINENAQVAVRVNNELGGWFNVRKATRQGDPVSPYAFITHLERVMSCHVMSSRRRRFATVGCMDESMTSNTLCLSQCVAGYHPIDQTTGRCCATSTFVVFHGFSLLPRDFNIVMWLPHHVPKVS